PGRPPTGNAGPNPSTGQRAHEGHEPVPLHLWRPLGPPEDPWLEAAGPHDPDPPSDPFDRHTAARATDAPSEPDQGSPMDAAALQALDARLAQIKHDAYTSPSYLTDLGDSADNLDNRDRPTNKTNSCSPG